MIDSDEQEQALLNAIYTPNVYVDEVPANIAARFRERHAKRLIYADWLDEQGDHDRARGQRFFAAIALGLAEDNEAKAKGQAQ